MAGRGAGYSAFRDAGPFRLIEADNIARAKTFCEKSLRWNRDRDDPYFAGSG
jgi:hypothetical protein